MKKRIKKIIGITMLGLSGIIFALIIYIIIKFKNVAFEQLLYTFFIVKVVVLMLLKKALFLE